MMTPEEERWCSDLLYQRYLQSVASCEVSNPEEVAASQGAPEPVRTFTRVEIDRAEIVTTDSGLRIWVYSGEGADADSFAGEIINPTERQMRGNGHVSCLWDCSKVISLEGARQ